MTFDGLNYLIFKNRKLTPSGYKGIGIRKFEFVTKTQFLCLKIFFIFLFFNAPLKAGKSAGQIFLEIMSKKKIRKEELI